MDTANRKWYRDFLITLYSIVFVNAFLLAFDLKRNSDDGFGSIFDEYLCVLVALPCMMMAVLLLVPYVVSYGPKRFPDLLPVILGVGVFISVPLGCLIGSRQKGCDFEHDRELAQEVIQTLEKHRADKGEYPTDLEDVSQIEKQARGKHFSGFNYKRDSSTSFTLGYGYGWYSYEYDSGIGEWESHD